MLIQSNGTYHNRSLHKFDSPLPQIWVVEQIDFTRHAASNGSIRFAYLQIASTPPGLRSPASHGTGDQRESSIFAANATASVWSS